VVAICNQEGKHKGRDLEAVVNKLWLLKGKAGSSMVRTCSTRARKSQSQGHPCHNIFLIPCHDSLPSARLITSSNVGKDAAPFECYSTSLDTGLFETFIH
jgi:hypothetical protein